MSASLMSSRCLTSARRLLPCAPTSTVRPARRSGAISSSQHGSSRATTSSRHSVSGSSSRRHLGVPLVAVGVVRVVRRDRRRRDVVAAAPHLHLVGPEALGGLRLVPAGEVAVVALVEAPVAPHRDPRPSHGPQRQLGGVDRPGLQATCGRCRARTPCSAIRRPAAVAWDSPSGVSGASHQPGEEVQLVPLALAVAEQHEPVRHRAHPTACVGIGGERPRRDLAVFDMMSAMAAARAPGGGRRQRRGRARAGGHRPQPRGPRRGRHLPRRRHRARPLPRLAAGRGGVDHRMPRARTGWRSRSGSPPTRPTCG